MWSESRLSMNRCLILTVLSGTEVNVWQDLGIFCADGKFNGYASIRSPDESRPDKGSFAEIVVFVFAFPYITGAVSCSGRYCCGIIDDLRPWNLINVNWAERA
jgi:hypothetical protein